MPELTTVPISMTKPIREYMLIFESASHRRPKEPIRLKGMVVITIREYLGDSNWAAITTNTRNTAVPMAENRAENSSFMD